MTTSKIEYDPTTLMGLSDHVFIKTTVATPYLKNRRTTSNDSHDQKIIYKWIEGTKISDYGNSAQQWTEHT
jgi:hypothetical protein